MQESSSVHEQSALSDSRKVRLKETPSWCSPGKSPMCRLMGNGTCQVVTSVPLANLSRPPCVQAVAKVATRVLVATFGHVIFFFFPSFGLRDTLGKCLLALFFFFLASFRGL